ncbi:MAG TPA: hypothetical protein DCP11_10265, partial [Microbacteriaceae bacterium]|nr:hypothetical protein [Microbacteriaceae bacterium]
MVGVRGAAGLRGVAGFRAPAVVPEALDARVLGVRAGRATLVSGVDVACSSADGVSTSSAGEAASAEAAAAARRVRADGRAAVPPV